MIRRSASVLAFLSIFLVIGCSLSGSVHGGEKLTLVSPEGQTVKLSVEIADTPDSRKMGLMHREELGQREGMLFVFERQQRLSFWMKNTLIPLDIFYFDAGGNFVSMQSMVPCTEDPCPLYPSDRDALYALEVNAGSGEKWGIAEGWRMVR